MLSSLAPPQVVFSGEVRDLVEWATRTGLPLPTSAEALGTNYAKAHRSFLAMKNSLVQQHGWVDASTYDPRLLFSIECDPPHRSSLGVPRSPRMTLSLPTNASSFFTPERRVQWQMVFHSATFPAMRHSVPTIGNMLHLLQCLLPGMLVIVKVEDVEGQGVFTTTRGLPPPEWIDTHRQLLCDIFGVSHYRRLFRAASDSRIAFKVERSQRPLEE